MLARILDLSGPIRNGAEWFGPPCEPVAIYAIGSLTAEGWVSHVLHMSTISGTTYVETGGHLLPDGPLLEEIPLEHFMLDAQIWRCEVREREIQPPPAISGSPSLRGKALLILCGWACEWGSARFAEATPYFSRALQNMVLASGPTVLASDAVSFDPPTVPQMPFLRAWFRQGGIIVSPVCPAAECRADRGRLVIAPLKLQGVNASPCRVFLEY